MATTSADDGADEKQIEGLKIDADAGDEHAQLLLGQHYLKLAQLDEDSQPNAKMGVSFLIRSSKQGNDDATKLLTDCLEKDLGVDDENKSEVVWCSKTPHYDRVAREAFRKMFRELKPQMGQDGLPRVPKSSFTQSASEVATTKTEMKLLMKAARGNTDVSENDFVDKMMRRLEGRGSSLTSSVKNDADWESFKVSSFSHKLRHYPVKTATWMLEATIETAGTQGGLWLRSLIPMNQIYTLVAVLIYSVISLDAVLWLLPLVTFYVSFAVLIIVSAQMLQSKRRLGDVRTIATMLSRFMLFDEQTAASMYMWNSMKPYATFFLALPLCIASLTVADSGWLLCPEFGALSAVTSFACFIALSDRYDHLAVASISIDSFSAILPALIGKLPQIPIIHAILWYLFGPGFAIELPVHGLYVRLGLPSLAFLVVPVIFLRMAAQRSWQGTYQILVPHLVCFFWWRLTIAFFAKSTWFGIARAFVGWIGLVFFLPLAPFFLIAYGIYVFRNVTSFASVLKVFMTIFLVVGASVFVWWSRSGFRIGSWFSLQGKSPISRAAVILVIVLASCVPLAYVFVPPRNVDVADNKVGVLSWDSYHRYCLSPQASLISCGKFKGARIASAGVLKQLSVISVENPAEAFASWLPYPFSNWLRCAYGEYYPGNCSMLTDEEDFEACTFSKQQGHLCHLRELDRYMYELIFDVSETATVGGSTVRVVAVHWFRSIADRVQLQTEVTFGAVLSTAVPGPGFELKLESIRCVGQSCEVGDEADYEEGTGRWRSLVLMGHAVHAVWNFFLSPLVAFSSGH